MQRQCGNFYIQHVAAQAPASGTPQPQSVVQRKLCPEPVNDADEWAADRVAQRTANPTDAPSLAEQPMQPSIGDHKNNTGLPNRLKTGIETLSGLSMDDVRVRYNSPKPAQLHALAYTQGTKIHVGPGQERHLPHEAWHVVQQMQGRVKPTVQMKGGVNINDDVELENEADVMGKKAVEVKSVYSSNLEHPSTAGRSTGDPIQLVGPFKKLFSKLFRNRRRDYGPLTASSDTDAQIDEMESAILSTRETSGIQTPDEASSTMNRIRSAVDFASSVQAGGSDRAVTHAVGRNPREGLPVSTRRKIEQKAGQSIKLLGNILGNVPIIGAAGAPITGSGEAIEAHGKGYSKSQSAAIGVSVTGVAAAQSFTPVIGATSSATGAAAAVMDLVSSVDSPSKNEALERLYDDQLRQAQLLAIYGDDIFTIQKYLYFLVKEKR
ncbi:DUF4157 domain-containing protein [Chloroflexi bacterium TSY]|nr:DUF4157 domain-containing protein [Chloroflexi bacterium TSY]